MQVPVGLERGETITATYRIEPFALVKSGGFFLKITAYQPIGTNYTAYLTQQRMIIESQAASVPEKAASWAALQAVKYAVGLATGTHIIGGGEGLAARSRQQSGVYEVPLATIRTVSTVRQGLARLVKLELADGQTELVFLARKPGGGTMNLGCSDDFIGTLRTLRS